MNPFSLQGQVALVTGANTGLGQGIAVALAQAGADIAAAVGFLCSEEAGFITGQNILLDGGAFPGTL